MKARTILLAMAVLPLFLEPTLTGAADAVPPYVTQSLDLMGRTRWDAERDAARHPGEVVAFSQIKPGMRVVDLVPGDTYYTRILSRLVGAKGRVYAVVPDNSGGGPRGARQNQRAGKPPAYVPEEDAEQCIQGCYPGSKTYVLPVDLALALENVKEFRDNVEVNWENLADYGGDLPLPEQIDAVFSADGLHELYYRDLVAADSGVPGRVAKPKPIDVAALDKSIFEDLKPGGTYTIVDYAAASGAPADVADKLHRLDENVVKKDVLAAGFVLDGESKLLAQSSDDHSKLVGGKFAARDKTDQFVLRFKKPANASGATKRPSAAQEAEIMKNYYGNTHILNADLTSENSGTGDRLRYHYYMPDHTYQEMGRVGEGPGPLQEGTWFWSAKGNNCMLHEFPLDERGNVVCHDYVVSRPLNEMQTQQTGARKGTKFKIVPGHVYIP
jgi:predicted methyltransferase